MGSSSLTRDQAWTPALGVWSSSHCTTREVSTVLHFDCGGQIQVQRCHRTTQCMWDMVKPVDDITVSFLVLLLSHKQLRHYPPGESERQVHVLSVLFKLPVELLITSTWKVTNLSCLITVGVHSLIQQVMEKEMATHSSILAWRIPGTGDPGGLPSMGSHRVRHDWSDLAAADTVRTRFLKVAMTDILARQSLWAELACASWPAGFCPLGSEDASHQPITTWSISRHCHIHGKWGDITPVWEPLI